MQKGDCFWGDPSGGTNIHPCLVLTTPSADGDIAIVNLTTGSGGVKAQTVTPLFLPMLEHESELNWFDAGVYDDAFISGKIRAGGIWSTYPPISPAKVDTLIMIGVSKRLLRGEFHDYLRSHP